MCVPRTFYPPNTEYGGLASVGSKLIIKRDMSIRKTPFVAGEFYHIYNRGNSKQKIFHDKKDYERFVKLLYFSNSNKSFEFRNIAGKLFELNRGKILVSIGAYCLMPNHFHILVSQKENGSISKFMQKLTTAYSMYYNT